MHYYNSHKIEYIPTDKLCSTIANITKILTITTAKNSEVRNRCECISDAIDTPTANIITIEEIIKETESFNNINPVSVKFQKIGFASVPTPDFKISTVVAMSKIFKANSIKENMNPEMTSLELNINFFILSIL